MSEPEAQPRIAIITGLSGSGKTTAVHALEDLGFFCVDNLPSGLFHTFLSLIERSGELQKVAIVMDAREREFPSVLPEIEKQVQLKGFQLEVLFLEARSEVLIRRFSETRRKHPLGGEGDLKAAVATEREMLASVRERADLILDSSELNVHQLKSRVLQEFSGSGKVHGELVVRLVSYGFKFGAPQNADILMDVRFLPNPHFEPDLRDDDGRSPRVAAYALETDDGRGFLQRFGDLLQYLIPRYRHEGKAYLTIGVGCTGGKHRSVAVVEHLGKVLASEETNIYRIHRDLDR